MPKIFVIYDPTDMVKGFDPDLARQKGIKEASLSVSDDLSEGDIHGLAKRLADLLLEQL